MEKTWFTIHPAQSTKFSPPDAQGPEATVPLSGGRGKGRPGYTSPVGQSPAASQASSRCVPIESPWVRGLAARCAASAARVNHLSWPVRSG